MPLPHETTLLDMPVQADDVEARKAEAEAVLKAKGQILERQRAWAELGPSKSYIRKEWWFSALPLTVREQDVLGRVWSFQAPSENGEGSCYESVAHIAKTIGIDKKIVKNALKKMVDLGILTKESQGPREPAVYQVDLVTCSRLVNGYKAARDERKAEWSKLKRDQWLKSQGLAERN